MSGGARWRNKVQSNIVYLQRGAQQMSDADWKRQTARRIQALKVLARKRRSPNCKYIAKALAVCGSRKWSASRLGDLVGLTDEERERWKLWPLRPCDLPWHKVQERRKERQRAADRERRRKRREVLKMARDLDAREESVFVALPCGRWTSVSDLITTLQGSRAWLAPDGYPLTNQSLRVLIHRALDKLAAQCLIESKTKVGHTGRPTRFVCRPKPDSRKEKTAKNKDNTVTITLRGRRRAGNAHKTGTSETGARVAPISEKRSHDESGPSSDDRAAWAEGETDPRLMRTSMEVGSEAAIRASQPRARSRHTRRPRLRAAIAHRARRYRA